MSPMVEGVRGQRYMPNQHTITETKLYQLIQIGLSRILREPPYNLKSDDFHIMRIESPSTPGVPDLNVCIKFPSLECKHTSVEFWIECKIAPNKLGNYQVAWHKKRNLAGGKVFVLHWTPGIKLDEELVRILEYVI